MANSFSTAYRANGLTITGWLLFAAIAGALTISVWIASAVKPAASHKQKTVEIATPPDPLIKLSSTNPNEMATAVKPLTFDAVVRDMRNYPPQFTDGRFLKTNTGKWTIQIMNVAEHEVVTDYLNGREDKDNFKYFRIVDENNKKRYVVTYGLYGSLAEADNASKAVDFGLPSNVKPFSEEIRSYLAQVDEYEVTPPVTDLGTKAPKEVKLHSTPKVIPAPKAKSKDDKTATSTETTDTPTPKETDDDPAPAAPKSTNNQAPVVNNANTAKAEAPKSTQPKAAVPTRPVPRGEALVIQDKPVPAFVEKPHKAADTTQPTKKTATHTTDVTEKPKKSDTSQKSDRANEPTKEKSQ